MIPPEADGEFVAHMEEVLETYEKAYDPAARVLCMDEQPVQLLNETRQRIPATEDHPERVDYEYERAMFAEPLSGFRQATARTQRTKLEVRLADRRIMTSSLEPDLDIFGPYLGRTYRLDGPPIELLGGGVSGCPLSQPPMVSMQPRIFTRLSIDNQDKARSCDKFSGKSLHQD